MISLTPLKHYFDYICNSNQTKIKMKPEFKKEYADKLKELGVYDQFVKNWENDEPSATIFSMNSASKFDEFVLCAFFWRKTPEGADFWANISEQ